MKYPTYAIIMIAAVAVISCDQRKAAIDEAEDATRQAIETRKAEVSEDAKYATERTEENAAIDKARIEADKVSARAQLEADKKKVEAEADAARAKVDAENQ